jgi:hypothetical protein
MVSNHLYRVMSQQLTARAGYPVFIPAYAPFVYMPYTPGLYAASPGCMALSQGAVGACVAGTFSQFGSTPTCGAGMYAAGMGMGGKSEPKFLMCSQTHG